MMERFANDDKNVRLERYIMEYNNAVENYKVAKEVLKNWTKDNDAYIYNLCSLCSDNLYKAVEHFLREAIDNRTVTDQKTKLIQLCELLKEDERFIDVELSVFVTEKQPRNQSTHLGRLSELGAYYRVIRNLYKLIRILKNDAKISEVPEESDKFDYSRFWYDVEEFDAENCHYLLMIDPVNDITNENVCKILSMPWSMIVDFDGKSLQGKIGKRVLELDNVQISSLNNVKKQGISKTTFKLNKTVYLSMETGIVPRLYKNWGSPDKNNFEFWIKQSKTLDKDRVIVVLAKKMDSVSELFIGKIIDEYGNENVKLIFLEDAFLQDDIERIQENYEQFFYYNMPSFVIPLKEIASHQKSDVMASQKTFEGIKLPGHEEIVYINDKALLDNVNQYFEILDLDKGNDSSNIYSEEEFLKGEQISWEALRLKYDEVPVEMERYNQFIGELINSLKTVESKNKLFSILHKPGFGGTTLSRRIAWDIHERFPVLLLNNYNSSETWDILTAFYECVKKGIMVVADENNISRVEIEELQKKAKNSIFPIAVLNVSRIRLYSDQKKESYLNQKKDLYVNVIEEESCKRLEHRCEKLASQKYTREEIDKRKVALSKVNVNDKCPLLVGLFYLEDEFLGTHEYVKRFIDDLTEDIDSEKIKKAMSVISMCDFFGQKKVYPTMITQILNPTKLNRFSVRECMKRVQDLFLFETHNGATSVKPKHYLISKEIVKLLFVENTGSVNWRDCIAEKSKLFIDLTLSVCNMEIDPDLQTLLKDMFANRDTEYLRGKFSLLIESCSMDEDREKILVYLTNKYDKYINENIDIESHSYNEYQLLAHFWGHLGRFYIQKNKMNNPSKAEDCCKKALEYSERIGYYDGTILHIAGDTTWKRMQLIMENIENIDELRQNIDVLVEGISEAQEYFEKAVIYGNEEYGNVGLLELWTRFLLKISSITGLRNVFDINEIEGICRKIDCVNKVRWILDGISKTIELIDYVDYSEYSDTAQLIIYSCKSDFESLYQKSGKTSVLQELNNYLSKLSLMPIKDSEKIASLKRIIIWNILNKYRGEKGIDYSRFDESSKEVNKDLETLISHLNDNLSQIAKKNNDYVLWFNIVRYSNVSVDDAIRMGNAWWRFQQEQKIVDPKPAYYLYVLNYIRALNGYVNSIEEAERYRKICKKICEDAKKSDVIVNYSKVRDWLANGKGMKALVDDRNVEYSEMLSNSSMLTVKGRFERVDSENRRVYGYMVVTEPVGLKGVEVFFKPRECGVSNHQIGHTFEFILGFSFERMVAFDKSIKDLTSKNIYTDTKVEEKVIKKAVVKGDLVHMKVYVFQNEKKRLKGIILENGKTAFLSQGEIDYNHYVTDDEMKEYEGEDNLEVKVIGYREEYDCYYVSVKQVVKTNDNIQTGIMGELLKNIKIDEG